MRSRNVMRLSYRRKGLIGRVTLSLLCNNTSKFPFKVLCNDACGEGGEGWWEGVFVLFMSILLHISTQAQVLHITYLSNSNTIRCH